MAVDCVYTNGCSLTYGSELEDRENDCYPSKVAKHFNLPVINNAKPGSSNQRILRTTIQDVEDLLEQGKTPLVLVSWTISSRFELCDENDEWKQFSEPDDKLSKIIFSKYSSNNGQFETLMLQMTLMENFLKQKEISGLQFNMFPMPIFNLDWETLDKNARKFDRQYTITPMFNIGMYVDSFYDWDKQPNHHPGPKGHTIISDLLIKYIEERYGSEI